MKITNSLRAPVRRTPLCIQAKLFSVSPSLSWINKRLSTPAREQQFKEDDRVPDSYKLIYKAPMQYYVAWSMHTSTITASVISVAALYQFVTSVPLLDTSIGNKTIEPTDIYYFTAGFILINALLRFVISKFPLRIYRDNEK